MKQRTLQAGTVEYLSVSVTANVLLDTQDVDISFDRVTWHPAEWVGVAAMTRSAEILLDESNTPRKGTTNVYVRIEDVPEIPVLEAGVLHVT